MKTQHHIPRRQQGAALVIGLILLMIITLLAVVGMNMSNSELASATSEQLRLRAFAAAETGVERALTNVVFVAGTTWPSTPVAGPVTDVVGVGTNASDGTALARYQNTVQFRGDGPVTGYSRNFRAYHFSVVSTGTANRNTTSVLTVGAFMVK